MVKTTNSQSTRFLTTTQVQYCESFTVGHLRLCLTSTHAGLVSNSLLPRKQELSTQLKAKFGSSNVTPALRQLSIHIQYVFGDFGVFLARNVPQLPETLRHQDRI